jgi:hypothetical protein
VLSISWWLVLAPTWLQLGLHGYRTVASLRALIANREGSEEERMARLGAAAAGALALILGAVCFLLLSLRVGGQATYPSVVIASPVFGLLGLLCCCGCCCACVASLVRRAQQRASGNPPYNEVRDEEAGAPESAVPESVTPPLAEAPEEAPAEDAPFEVAPAFAAAAMPEDAPPTDHAPAVGDMPQGQSEPTEAAFTGVATATSGDAPATAALPAAATLPAPVDAPSAASDIPAPSSARGLGDLGTPAPPVVSTSASEPQASARAALRSMSVREMRSELSARGVAHDHCLEKEELVALMAQQRGC